MVIPTVIYTHLYDINSGNFVTNRYAEMLLGNWFYVGKDGKTSQGKLEISMDKMSSSTIEVQAKGDFGQDGVYMPGVLLR